MNPNRRGADSGHGDVLPDSALGSDAGADLSTLYLQYLASPSQVNLDRFLHGCIARLAAAVNMFVQRQGICPSSLAPSTFARDCVSRACEKLWLGIHALHTPEGLPKWLKQVALSAVVEEFYTIARRTKGGPCSFGPIEVEQPNGNVLDILDRPEYRNAAHRYGSVTVERVDATRELVYRDLLGKLFQPGVIVSECDRDGILLLERIARTGITIKEIAEERACSETSVRQLLSSTRRKLRRVAESKFKFTAADL